MTKQDLKNLFLKLTEYTIPPGEESRLEKYLPSGYKKDSSGNYYYTIGKSETLFTTHLDTYCTKVEKVNHITNDKNPFKIKTDGKTILGGDNKLGCCILIGMIEKEIPGTYYFFIGEEPILNGGLAGSSDALKANPNFFKQFKRCIAFDRREYGDLNYTYKVLETACQIDFEMLPVVRELEVRFSQEKSKLNITPFSKYSRKINYDEIIKLCEIFDLSVTRNILKDNNQHITVPRWLEDYDIDIYLNGIDIVVNNKIVSLKELKMILLKDFKNDITEQLEYYIELYSNGVEQGKKSIIKILSLYDCKSIEQFKKLLN